MDVEYELYLRYKNMLQYENRFFIDKEIQTKLISVINNKKKTMSKNTVLYRGRIHYESRRNKYLPSQMGPPPKEVKSMGRFSSSGLNYLYLGSDTKTCVSELRPEINSIITMGKFTCKRSLNIVDLTDDHATSYYEENFNLAVFVLLLGGLFSVPIKREDQMEYLPMQYFAELAKTMNIDAIKYNSSFFRDGEKKYNLVVFDSNNFKCVSTEKIKIEGIKYDYSRTSHNT